MAQLGCLPYRLLTSTEKTHLVSFKLKESDAYVPHDSRSFHLHREWHLVHCNPPLLDGRKNVLAFEELAPFQDLLQDSLFEEEFFV